jgi:hypothetical protein
MTSLPNYSAMRLIPSAKFTLLLRLLTLFILSIAVTGCDNQTENAETAEAAPLEIIVLDDSNVDVFRETFIQDYIELRNELLTQFKVFKKANDPYKFAQYRNYQWTPRYIEKKNYYQAVLNKNRAYIDKKALKPMMLRFENLLYIGVNLKNALLDDNTELLKSTYAEIKADKAIIDDYKK